MTGFFMLGPAAWSYMYVYGFKLINCCSILPPFFITCRWSPIQWKKRHCKRYFPAATLSTTSRKPPFSRLVEHCTVELMFHNIHSRLEY